MDLDLVIRGGRVVTSQGVFAADIGISGERIAVIGENLPAGRKELDATGRWVMPGGVDPHAHIEQMSGMGLMNADTFESATRSALLGGTTSVISFAAQPKGVRLRDVVADYAARAKRGALIDHAFHMTVSDPDQVALTEDLPALIAAGHRSIKVFTTYNIRLDDRQILDVMSVARAHGALVCVHAENDALIGWMRDRMLAAGLTRPQHHALSRPRMAEIDAVERMIRFAEFLDQPLMLFHISTTEGAAAVARAQRRGVPVRAETCPHYLLMTDAALDRDGIDGAKWMCSPPQRKSADVAGLWQALAEGTIEVVSSDHSPYRFDASGKLSAGPNPPFPQIANGMPGLETRLPLMFDAMVSRRGLPPEAFVRATSTAPARLYGLERKGDIAPGLDADLVLWDPVRSVTWGDNDLHDNVGYNPFAGETVIGWPDTVLLRGRIAARAGAVLVQPGEGRWLQRNAPGFGPTGRQAEEIRIMEGKDA
jgi:dihydropyrimidinase